MQMKNNKAHGGKVIRCIHQGRRRVLRMAKQTHATYFRQRGMSKLHGKIQQKIPTRSKHQIHVSTGNIHQGDIQVRLSPREAQQGRAIQKACKLPGPVLTRSITRRTQERRTQERDRALETTTQAAKRRAQGNGKFKTEHGDD